MPRADSAAVQFGNKVYQIEKFPTMGIKQLLDAYEKQLIEDALTKADSVNDAAIILKLPPSTLYRRMDHLGIRRRKYRDNRY